MNRLTTFIVFFFAGISTVFAQLPASEKIALRNEFRLWQKQQLQNHTIWAKDSCTMKWIAAHGTEGEPGLGFPEADDFMYSFADLNGDGKQDQLVTFTPVQCDGGNAVAWMQFAVLTLSQQQGYKTVSNLDEELFPNFHREANNFYRIIGIAPNRVETIHYAFSEDDLYCCPSFRDSVVFNYRSGMIVSGQAAAEGKKLFLGSVLCDSASVKLYGGNMPAMDPILNSTNKIEIRFVLSHFGDHDEVLVLSLGDTWSVNYYLGDKQTAMGKPIPIVSEVDPEELFVKLVDNKIFSLSDSRSLKLEQLTLDPGTGTISGKGLDISHPSRYIVEYKAGPYFRRYSYNDPHEFAAFYPEIDELRYFAAIVDLMNLLLTHE